MNAGQIRRGTGRTRRTRRARRTVSISALALWSVGYVIVGIGLATAAVWPVYESPRAIIVGVAGGLVGVGIAVCARLFRWGLLVASLAAVGAYLVLAVPLAIPSAMSSIPAFLGGLRDAVLGVVVGWKQMLTLNPPLGEYQAVLVPLLVVMLFGGFVATLLAMHPGRRASAAVVVVAGMSVFGIAFGLGATSAAVSVGWVVLPAPREWLIGVAVFVSALVFLIGRTRLQRASALRTVAAKSVSRRGAPVWPAIRRHVLAGGIVVIALIAGMVIAPTAAGWTDRSVLRDEIEPMIVVQKQPSPLSAYRSWFTNAQLDDTVVQMQGDPGAVDRIRLVTLDSYDGEDFHISLDTRFSRLPRAAAPGEGRVELGFTVGDGYRGIWVPAPGGLAAAPEFEGSRADELADGFHIDDSGETAITVAPVPGGGNGLVPGDRYSVLVDPPGETESIAGSQGGESTLDADAYPALVQWAAMQDQPGTGAGYLELIDRLRSRGYLSHGLLEDEAAAGWIADLKESEGYSFAPSYAGHSAARIEELFTALIDQEVRAGSGAAPELLVSAVGDDEQFATAAALLAQYWGLESRVVIGARLASAEEVPGIAACSDVCTGASMSAWVEVRASGGAWSTVDVTPQFALLPSTLTEGEQLPEHPTVPEQPRSEAMDPPLAQSDSQADAVPLSDDSSAVLAILLPILRAVGLGLAALVLLLLPFLVLVFAKRRRARLRRRAPDAEVRLTGAWEELADLYADHAIEMDPRGTRAQRAASTGRADAAALATLVDRGVFAGHGPAAEDADAAWAIVDAERSALAGETRRWQRLRARWRPTSFLARILPARGVPSPGGRRALGTLAVAGSFADPKKEDS
ncbi:transglutaminase domain-containing protein [Microbacterium sp.]|uniref:transglutaminase domain-containing protein n=1 Tax=Microbacterium sp. TaxID=51671 RepID=UPI003F9A76E3